MKRKLLIVGIDPGTATGLAILNSKGKPIKLKAKKEFSESRILRAIVKEGKPLILATDRSSCPSLIRDIRAKLDCRLFLPEEDISEKKKSDLTLKFKDKLENKHEKDALASALYAFKQFKGLFRRIRNRFTEEEKVREAKKRILLGEAKNIEEALE